MDDETSIVLKRCLTSWNGIGFNGSQPLAICTKPSFWFNLDIGGCDLILHVGIVKLTIALVLVLVDITCTMILVQLANPQMAWGIRDGRVQGLWHKKVVLLFQYFPNQGLGRLPGWWSGGQVKLHSFLKRTTHQVICALSNVLTCNR